MPYSVNIEDSGPWLVIDFEGVVSDEELVASRAEAARLNADLRVSDFILDFTDVTSLVLGEGGAEQIAEIDQARTSVLRGGRCAIVAQREPVELGAGYLGAVSRLDLDFRAFRHRADAEAWLRGELDDPPPPLPRSRRR